MNSTDGKEQTETLFLADGGIAYIRQSHEVTCDGCDKRVKGWVHKETFNFCFACMDKRFGKCCHPENERRVSAFTGTNYCGLCSAIFAPIGALTKEQEQAAELASLRSRLAEVEKERDCSEKFIKKVSTWYERSVEMMRRNDFKFERFPRNLQENPPKDDGEKWEAIAFDIYCSLAEICSMANIELANMSESRLGVALGRDKGMEGK